MKKVATLGEILMRLATPNKERILQVLTNLIVTQLNMEKKTDIPK